MRAQLAPPLASSEQLDHLADETQALDHEIQTPAVAGSVDAYNADVARGNALVAQYNAINAKLRQQIAALPGSGATID